MAPRNRRAKLSLACQSMLSLQLNGEALALQFVRGIFMSFFNQLFR
jgi:hypothetical protein